MKTAAVAELKERLVKKFGDTEEVRVIVEKEVTHFCKTKTKISVEDLNSLENRLLTLVGFPASRRIRWSSLHPSGTVVSNRIRPASNRSASGFSPPQQSPPIATTHSVDFQSVPMVSEIAQITRHWKPVGGKKSNTIFPRYEDRSEYSPRPDRIGDNAGTRTTFNWGHGHTEDLRFRGRGKTRDKTEKGLDQWGDVLRWDTTKYLWEQEEARKTNKVLKSMYREELNAQVKARELTKVKEKEEIEKEKTEEETQLAKFRLKTEKEALSRKETQRQHQSSLLHVIDSKEGEKQQIAQEKKKEGELLQKKHKQDMWEELERIKATRLHHQSLGDENIRTLLKQRADLDFSRVHSQLRERQQIEEFTQRKEAEEEQRKGLSLRRAKEIQEENKKLQFLSKKKSPRESLKIAHLDLFQKHDSRVNQMHEEQRKNVRFLNNQMMEKTEKDGIWKKLTNEQAELWTQEQATQLEEDKQKEKSRKQKKELMKLSLIAQMKEKKLRKISAARLSPAEAKINRSLVQAATGFS